MNRATLAVATAMLVAGLGAGIGPAPFAAAQSTVCGQDDFDIKDSEPLDVNARTLSAGASEVGTEDVASGSPEQLHVEMVEAGRDGKLHWVVKFLDGDDCVKLDPIGCEGNITTDDTEQTCDLDAPNSGTRTYHVLFEEVNQTNPIDYKPWES